MRSQMLIYLFRAIAMLLTIPFHEAAHAWASAKLGDDTAARQGRLTLNPIAHFDLWGALCMIFVGFGWAKPVSTDPRRFRDPKRGMALTALAGPVANLLLAYLAAVLHKVLAWTTPDSLPANLALLFLHVFISLNVALAVFNLIPLPPFDGGRVATAFLPNRLYFGLMRYERYILLAVFALLFFGVLDLPLSWLQGRMWEVLDWATLFVDKLFSAAQLARMGTMV